jgi:hypothetical protein
MKPLVILSVIVLSVPSFSPLAFGSEIPTVSVVLELFPIHEGFLVSPVQLRGTGNLNSSNSGCIYGIYIQGSYANSPPDSIAFQVIATPPK